MCWLRRVILPGEIWWKRRSITWRTSGIRYSLTWKTAVTASTIPLRSVSSVLWRVSGRTRCSLAATAWRMCRPPIIRWYLLAGPTVSPPWLIWRIFSVRWSKGAGIMRTCYRWPSESILTNLKNQVWFLKTLRRKLPKGTFPMGYVKIGRLPKELFPMKYVKIRPLLAIQSWNIYKQLSLWEKK